jgi:hypothetical protein
MQDPYKHATDARHILPAKEAAGPGDMVPVAGHCYNKILLKLNEISSVS